MLASHLKNSFISSSLITDFFLLRLDAGPGRPYYSVDIDNCVCKSHCYVYEVNQHFFQIERGSRFYLKLDLYGVPRPLSPDYKVTLTRDKTTQLQGVASTALIYDIELIDVQIATRQHEDCYTITASTEAGLASLRFVLLVEGTWHSTSRIARNFHQEKIFTNFVTSFVLCSS